MTYVSKFILAFIGFVVFAGSEAFAKECDYEVLGKKALEMVAKSENIDYLIDCETPKSIEDLNVDQKIAVHAMMLAYGARPYGASKSLSADKMFLDAGLDCDNYSALASILYKELGGRYSLTIIGWYIPSNEKQSAFNHAQVYYDAGENSLILDPTVAILALGSFDDVAMGHKLKVYNLSFRREIEPYRTRVINIISNGTLRPSNILYYMPDIDSYRKSPSSSRWATPGAKKLNEFLKIQASKKGANLKNK